MAHRSGHRGALQFGHREVNGKWHENHGDRERNGWARVRGVSQRGVVASDEGERHKGDGEA